jgi:lipopolysaccharide/colanic/teichoic acid biosynthesis glycosyltransferase
LGRAGGSDGGSETAPLVSDFVRHVSRKVACHGARGASLDLAFASPLPAWKRGMDVTVAGVALACLLPLLALIALAIRLSSGSPVIFRQRRAGLMGRPFEIYKFRTMVVDAEARQKDLRHLSEQDGPAFKLTRDPRVTRLGGFLRKTSLDELPQLWNVLKGDMSLVGPRPLPCGESEECSGWQRRRMDVTPGITCIWQVKGRSSVTFHEWMRMDAAYVRTRRFLYDVQLLLLTIPAVLLRRGAR